MKILIIRLSSIGDVVLTTPVLRCLHNQLDDVELHYLTKAQNIPLLEHNPYIDVLHEYKQGYGCIRELQREKFNLVIDLHNNFRSCRVCEELHVRCYTYNKENFHKFFYLLTGRNVMSGRHVVDRYMKPAERLHVVNDGLGLDCFLAEADIAEARHLMDQQVGASAYCVVVCGAQHYTKQIPTEGVNSLCASMQMPVVLLGDTSDRQRLEHEGVRLTPKDVNLCGNTTLPVSAAIVRDAAVVVTSDTGLMHIAAAFHRPVVAVWGATAPPLGFTPYCTSYVDSEVEGLRCHPCSRQGGKRCRHGHFACMMQQNWLEVASKAQRLATDNTNK